MGECANGKWVDGKMGDFDCYQSSPYFCHFLPLSRFQTTFVMDWKWLGCSLPYSLLIQNINNSMYVLNLDNLGMNVAAGIGAECKKYILPGSLRRSGIYLG